MSTGHCINCGVEVIGKMAYCSDKCRQRASRARRATVTEGPVTKPTVTDNLDKPKRGKDIKCFEDLPPDVQRTIEMLSDSEEEKQRRTGIAIHYQHVFPERFSICNMPSGEIGCRIGLRPEGNE